MTVMDPAAKIAEPNDDPYLWLEEIEGSAAVAWVAAQNLRTFQRFASPAFTADRETLAHIFGAQDKMPYVYRQDGYIYNFWSDEQNLRGVWRRTTLKSYRDEATDWDVLFDLDLLAEQEGEDWTWGGAVIFQKADRALFYLSRGGRDAVVIREFDLHARRFVEGGFYLPESKGSAFWLDADNLILSSAAGPDMGTSAGYARTIRLWRRGERIEEAKILFETAQNNMCAFAVQDVTQKSETIWFVESLSYFDAIIHIGDRAGPRIPLELPVDIHIRASGDWFAVLRRAEWEVCGKIYPQGTLLGGFFPFLLQGALQCEPLFEPRPRRALQEFFWAGDRLILVILDDLRPVFESLTPSAEGWSRTIIEGIPEIGVASIGPLDIDPGESDGSLIATVESPIVAPSQLLIEAPNHPTLLKRAPLAFSTRGINVSRHEVLSADGERIPYFQVGPERETGDAPVLLTGYGGFGVSMLPCHDAGVGKLWLERGGVSVVACLRGGGEFGVSWHDAGRREKKRLAHDDFAAVAADLVRRGVTRPERIAAYGASNGGLLVCNMLTRYPGLFGALFCALPLIDMRRYSKLLAGSSWIAEFGDPDQEEDWKYLQGYSPYHAVEPNRRYPPILLATSRQDDRVHPAHARKMAAKLQAMGHEAWFYEGAGGHGYGKDPLERATFTALGFSFLREKIGWLTDTAGP